MNKLMRFVLLWGTILSAWRLQSGELGKAYGRIRENMASEEMSDEKARERYRELQEDLLHCIGSQFKAPHLDETLPGGSQARDAVLASLIYSAFSGDIHPRFSSYHRLSDEQRREVREVLLQRLSLVLAVYPICRAREPFEELSLAVTMAAIYPIIPDAVAEAASRRLQEVPEDRRLPLVVLLAFHSGEEPRIDESDRAIAESCLSVLRTMQRVLRRRLDQSGSEAQ